MEYSNVIFTKPMFTGMPTAWAEHVPFAFYLIETLRPATFVELGTFTGVSYFSFCQAIKQSGVNTKAFAVDHWKGDQSSGFLDESVFKLVAERNETYFQEFSQLLRMSFDDALPNFEDKSIDLLHIDGCHTYEAVKHDFETWLPKMSDKGIILFHDSQEKTGDFGVWRFFEELKTKYPACELLHGHGLGIVCAGKDVNHGLLHFVRNCDDNSFSQRLFASLGKLVLTERIDLQASIAQLYYSIQPQSFTENNSVYSLVTMPRAEVIFKVKCDEKIKHFRFDPLDDYVLLKLVSIDFYYLQDMIYPTFHVSSNAVHYENDVFLFDTHDPQIYIDFKEPVEIDKVVFDVEYLKTGVSALQFTGEVIRNLKSENQVMIKKQTALYDMFLGHDKGSDDPETDLIKKVNQLLILHNSHFVNLLVWFEKGVKNLLFKIIRKK